MQVQWKNFGGGNYKIQSVGGKESFPGINIHIVEDCKVIEAEWIWLETYSSDPFSSYAWASAWYDAHEDRKDCSPVIIVGRSDENQPLFLLPLIKKKVGPFKVLIRPGSKHSAYFNGLFSPECIKLLNKNNAAQFWKSLFSTVPFADVLAIDGIVEAELNQGNPFCHLPLLKFVNSSFRMPIQSDWVLQYTLLTNSKARSNDRRCKKRLSELGDVEYHVAKGVDERLEMLDELMALKSRQFKTMKVPNPFEDQSVQTFYKNLIGTRSDQNQFFLSALRLDGEPIAINFGILHGSVLHGLILTMKTGEFRRFAPGRLLLLETNGFLAEQGIRIHDFGIGESDYKNTWCEDSVICYNVVVPLSIKGWLFARIMGWAAKLKDLIKRSDQTKKLVLRIASSLKFSKR